MSVMVSRRIFGAGFVGGLAALVGRGASAQFTEQEVRNGADIVATGDVNLSQEAAASQEATFGVYIDGELVTEDGVYQSSTGQVVINDGRVVATGDVNVSQTASASQRSVTVVRVFPTEDGDPARTCEPGAVIANPDTGRVYYQRNDCCWYAACANRCEPTGCQGNGCS